MTLKVVNGDLIQLALDGHFDVIVHGCNCFCAMGAGIAAQIKKKLPGAYEADLKTQSGDKAKLGNYTYYIHELADGNKFVVVNAYTQYKTASAPGELVLDYDALKSVLDKINEDFNGYKIGFPLIGCGLAGGDEKTVVSMIGKALEKQDITIVKFD